MRSLSDEQIDFIAEDIRKRGVFMKALEEDLLDHICCFIEEKTDDERPFEQVYLLALEAFGHNGLQEVQDETLFIINQPYQSAMKKFAYITGALSSVSLVGGAFFKIMHWPGANAMLILGTLVLSMFFIPYFFYVNLKEQTEKKSKVIAAFGLITALFLCAGALFKLMHWPGAIIMIGGFGLFFLIFLPLYIINGVRNPLTKVSSISNGFLFAAIGGFVMLMSFQQPSKAVTDSLTVIETNQEALLQQLQNEVNNDSTPIPTRYALNQFVLACNNAFDAVSVESDNAEPDKGRPLSPEELSQLNEKIQTAVKKLNADMNTNPLWKPIVFTDLAPSLYGSIRFQVMQLQCNTYVQALSMQLK